VAEFITYIKDAKEELLHKVSWPTWKELQSSAILVLITCIIISLFIWLMDYTFGITPIKEGESGWRGLLGYFYEMFNSSSK